MLFSLNGEAVKENTMLGDDTIRDVALKLTGGQGGVYLYGKQRKDVTAVTVWQKYNRPLTSWELVAELRNVGIRKKFEEDQTFEFEDLCDHFPRCEWAYVALGQTFPRGVRVKPPTQSYSLAEYQNVASTSHPDRRLIHYEGLQEVHAVTVRTLQTVYLPHAEGIVPEDARLRATVSSWVWNILREAYLLPSKPQAVDLQTLFSRVHATELVPCIAYGKVVRTVATVSQALPSTGLTFFLKKDKPSYVTFESNGTVKCVRVDAEEANPIVHYVNQVLTWGTALECDAVLIGKRFGYTPLFSNAVYPLWTPETKERTTLSANAERPIVLSNLSQSWHTAVAPSLEYVRCSPPATIEFEGSEVRVCNLPVECCHYACRYIEGWLCSDDAEGEETLLTEEADESDSESKLQRLTHDPLDAYVQKFAKAGYDMGMRYRGGILCMDENAAYGFVPCPASEKGINPGLLTEWIPTLSFDETKTFLEKAAKVASDCFPKETVLNFKGECVGVRTQGGSLVRCKPQLQEHSALRVTTEHEILFPKTGLVYGTYRELVRQHGVDAAAFTSRVPNRNDDCPRWRDGKLMLTQDDLEAFRIQLKNDMARFQHLRCYMLRHNQIVRGSTLDVFEGEEIKVL